MTKGLVLFLLLSTSALAQWDNQYLYFSGDQYAEIPFMYPSILTEDDVRDVIRQLAELTDDEIEYIRYHPSQWDVNSTIEIRVMLCRKGTRLRRECDQGWMEFFRKVDDRWVYQDGRHGSWAY